MRKIRVGAIQPDYPPVPPEFDCTAEHFRTDPEEIFQRYGKPCAEISFKLLEQAGEAGCSVVTSCEDLSGTSAFGIRTGTRAEGNVFPELLRLSAPYVEERLSAIAKKYHMVVIGCYNTRENGKNYNQAGIFGRTGEFIDFYRKTHLPPNEMWQTEAGDRIPVFDLDFGRVGIAICYDIMFPEMCQVLSQKGAEIVFHPTAGYGWYDSIGEATLRTRANDGDFYLVTAKNYAYNAAGKSSVIDSWGQVLADAGFYPNAVVTGEVDFEREKVQPEWFYPTVLTGIAGLRERKSKERRPELYGDLAKASEKLPIPDAKTQADCLKKMREGRCHW